MSKYTTEVRYICEHYAGVNESVGYVDINSIIESARSKIFDFRYPIFDEKYRAVLETKILKHYYMREIGVETVGLWKHYLDMKMNEIMPYYNQLYKSELLEFNPLYDVDITRDHERTSVEDRINTKEGETVEDRDNSKTRTGEVNKTSDIGKTAESEISKTGESEISKTGEYELSNTGDTKLDELITKNGENGRTQNDTTTTEEDTTGWTLYSDTPQGSVQNVELNGYLTTATKNTSEKGSTVGYDSTIDETNSSTENKENTVTDNRKENETHSETTNGANSETTNETNSETTNETHTQTNTDNETEKGKVTTSVNETDNGNINSTEDYLEHVKGKQGCASYSSMLMEYRKTFLNIDMNIIDDLSNLFMLLW